MTELLEPNDSRSEEQDTPGEDLTEEDEDSSNNLADEEGGATCDPDVLEIISHCAAKGLTFLDLSHRKLMAVPREVLLLDHIQCLYLEGNFLSVLPPNFFEHLPNLCWLDLRNNQLVAIPAAYLSNHDNLRTLLLGGNQIRALPLELGLLSSLAALNLAGNPIEFPPEHVIERGVTEIVAYLRRILLAKASGDPGRDDGVELPEEQEMKKLNEATVEAASSATEPVEEEEEIKDHAVLKAGIVVPYAELISSPPVNELSQLSENDRTSEFTTGSMKTGSASAFSDATSIRRHDEPPVIRLAQALNQQELLSSALDLGMESQSATLHKPVAYYQIRQQYMEKVRKGSGQGPTLALKRQSDKHSKFVNKFPEPPPIETVERRMLEERRKQRQKDVNDKQEAILQRRRDQETVKKFREESRVKQQARFLQQIRKEHSQIQAEANARLTSGPYDMDRGQLQVKSKEQWRADQGAIEAEPKPRPLSPGAVASREAERRSRDRELEARIRDHVTKMNERRSAQRSAKATAQEEVEMARRDMQIAENLHKEVSKRREAMDYRFQAFTGDDIHVRSRNKDKR